jgi:hypothetical protein
MAYLKTAQLGTISIDRNSPAFGFPPLAGERYLNPKTRLIEDEDPNHDLVQHLRNEGDLAAIRHRRHQNFLKYLHKSADIALRVMTCLPFELLNRDYFRTAPFFFPNEEAYIPRNWRWLVTAQLSSPDKERWHRVPISAVDEQEGWLGPKWMVYLRFLMTDLPKEDGMPTLPESKEFSLDEERFRAVDSVFNWRAHGLGKEEPALKGRTKVCHVPMTEGHWWMRREVFARHETDARTGAPILRGDWIAVAYLYCENRTFAERMNIGKLVSFDKMRTLRGFEKETLLQPSNAWMDGQLSASTASAPLLGKNRKAPATPTSRWNIFYELATNEFGKTDWRMYDDALPPAQRVKAMHGKILRDGAEYPNSELDLPKGITKERNQRVAVLKRFMEDAARRLV